MKGDQHREIEIKLDAPAGFALPALEALPGVVAVVEAGVDDLDAVYVDTDDLRLIRQRTTLRRRTGGDDAGWHLKLPVAKDERLEIRRAAGRSVRAVPAALKDLTAVHTRGAVLEPVAHISTRRTVRKLVGPDDVVLAEVADDAVTAEALGEAVTTDSWREIEVELVDGDRRLLDAARRLLTGSGARPARTDSKLQRILGSRLAGLEGAEPSGGKGSGGKAPGDKSRRKRKVAEPRAGQAVVAYLVGQLGALVAADPGVKLQTDEAVHDMRVATRRLRTVLAAYRPLFAEGSVEPLREELKWLGGQLGAVRDLDVLLALMHRELAEQPDELVVGAVGRRIDLELRAELKRARANLLEALAGERYFTLVGDLEQFVAHPPFGERAAGRADKELRRRVRKACRRVERAHSGLAALPLGPARDHQLHRVRIAAKRARYAAEAAVDVHGKRAKRLVKAMKAVQNVLGEHQDAVVEREVLRDLAMRAFLAGENTFTLGRLHGLTDARAAQDEERFVRTYRDARKRMARWPG